MSYENIVYKYKDLFGSLIMFGRIDLMGWGHGIEKVWCIHGIVKRGTAECY